MSGQEEGIYARIQLADVTLAEARDLVDDPTFFDTTRMAVLHPFPQVSLDGYEGLSVGDHRQMVDYLTAKGLI